MLSWTVNSGFDIAFILLALVTGFGLIAYILRDTRRDLDGLGDAAMIVQSATKSEKTPREAFAAEFDTVDRSLKDQRVVGLAWRRFATTLVPLEVEDGVTSENTLVSRSPSPTEYFSPVGLGLDRSHVSMTPGAFLAVFLLFAGIGLAGTIGAIAEAFGPDSGDMMRAAIASAGGKLLLFAVTVALYLALRLAVSWSRTAIAEGVRHFNDTLLDRVYFENAESAGTRRQDSMHFQAKSLQRLGEKLTTSIGGTTRDAIVEGYVEVVTRMEALTKRYDDLVSAAQKGAREAVEKAFDDSVETSADVVVKRMEAVAQHLTAIPERMEQAALSLQSAGTNISAEQQRFANDLQTTANDTVASAASAVARDVAESVRAALAESQNVSATISERLSLLPDRIEQAALTFENASAKMIDVQSTVAEETQTRTQLAVQSVTDMIKQATGEIAQSVDETIANSLLQTTRTLETVGENMTLLPDRLAGVARTLEQTTDHISETHMKVLANLQAGTREMTTTTAETIAAHVNQNTQTFLDKLHETNDAFEARTQSLTGLFQALERTGDRIAETHNQALADFKTSASEITAVTADAIAARVEENTTQFVEKLEQSNAAFEARAERLSSLYVSLEQASDKIAETHTRVMTQLQQAARDMTATTSQSISRHINENTQSFIEKLNESNAAFEERAGALTGLFSTLQKASDRIAETHTRFMDQMQQGARELTEATAETLSRSVNENTSGFIEKLNESNAAFEERAQALTGLFATLQKASDRIAQTHTGFMAEMQDSTRDIIAKTTSTIAAELQTNTTDIVSRLRESDDFFASRVEALSSLLPQIDQTGQALAGIMERVSAENGRVGVELSELAGSLHEATGGIKQSADRFSHNLLEVQQSLDDFHKLSKDTIEMVGTSQRTLKESIGMQAELWERHVERFDDVDRKLGDVFAEMSRQIDLQTRQMRDQVSEMDNALAGAVNHLGELVEELNETRAQARSAGTYG